MPDFNIMPNDLKQQELKSSNKVKIPENSSVYLTAAFESKDLLFELEDFIITHDDQELNLADPTSQPHLLIEQTPIQNFVKLSFDNIKLHHGGIYRIKLSDKGLKHVRPLTRSVERELANNDDQSGKCEISSNIQAEFPLLLVESKPMKNTEIIKNQVFQLPLNSIYKCPYNSTIQLDVELFDHIDIKDFQWIFNDKKIDVCF